jgi:hypothetical protein
VRDERAKIYAARPDHAHQSPPTCCSRHLSLGGKCQHGRSLLWLTPSPLICSRVIFKTSASKSPLERLAQTFFRRRARSFRRQSSLLSRLSESRPGNSATDAACARTNLSVMDNLAHLAAEVLRERGGIKVSPFAAVLFRQMGLTTMLWIARTQPHAFRGCR